MAISHLAHVKVGTGQPVRVMGVVNISPESFYKGSVYTQKQSLLKAVRKMVEEGADFIDVGAMSTAPYLKTRISEEEEAARFSWAVRLIRRYTDVPVSVDTARAKPAEAGLKAGARILNDISGLQQDPAMPTLAKRFKGLILMAHPMGYEKKRVKDPVEAAKLLLKESLKKAARAGVPASRIVLDPGIGFFRTLGWTWWQWDVEIIKSLERLASLKQPILVGISRKSFIGHLLGGLATDERLYGSLAATAIAVEKGAAVVRTHDVRATKEAVNIAEAISGAKRMGAQR